LCLIRIVSRICHLVREAWNAACRTAEIHRRCVRRRRPAFLDFLRTSAHRVGASAREPAMSGDDDDYVYDEASGEWVTAAALAATRATEDAVEVRDAVGNLLADGDQVTLIKDLEVKARARHSSAARSSNRSA
jgi:hypothetical protein